MTMFTSGKFRLFVLGLLTTCTLSVQAADKIKVVTTTTMISDLVTEVGGDRVEVHGLMGPGVDPHLYKPTASDIGRLQNAQLIIYNGLMLEGQMGELFERLAKAGKP